MSDKIAKCRICYEVFDRLRLLHLHCVQNHPKKFICCPICYQLSWTPNDFVEHSNSHHGRLTKENVLVDIEIRQPEYRKPYNSVLYVCFQMERVDFKPTTRYSLDERMVIGSRCVACLKCFRSKGNAHKHYEEMHLMVKYLCHSCPQLYTALNGLQYHFRHAHDFKPIVSIRIYLLVFRWHCF